jgi:hypothetical protein
MVLPEPAIAWKAVDLYVALAYDGSSPPPSVLAKLGALRAAAPSLYASPDFEHRLRRSAIRLGNRFYPHMKLAIEERPDGRGAFFRADSHDRHIGPQPGTEEARLFLELREKNAAIARAIEEAWEAEGIPTFRAFLREDLLRREGSMAPVPDAEPASGA